MKGSIRLAVGFFIVFGAVGTLEVEPDASLLTQFAVALVGLAVMINGARAANRSQ